MLRVRPIHHTAAMDAWAALLTALGLVEDPAAGKEAVPAANEASGWRLFDSGRGKVALHLAGPGSPPAGTTTFGFEIRDAAIFVRRTLADGTAAELVDGISGPAARVSAPDGFSFLADAVDDPRLPGDAPAGIAVLQLWHTPDPTAARKVLADIGARAGDGEQLAGQPVFKAKNGGLAAAHPGGAAAVELCLAHPDVAELARALAAQGLPGELAEGPHGRALLLPNPDGGARLRVFERPGA